MIDFNEYKTYFDTYAARYDKADGRVALKIVHTYAVVSVMERSLKWIPRWQK